MNAYTLRPATVDDLPRLLEIHEGAFRALVETRFAWEPPLQLEIVSESLMLQDQGDALFLERIMLAPEVQGRGLGSRIVEDIQAQARARGIGVTLSVWENNRARRLYERLGFVETAQVEFRVKLRWDP